LGTNLSINYKDSSDGGSTWGTETAWGEAPFSRNYAVLFTSPITLGQMMSAMALDDYAVGSGSQDPMYLNINFYHQFNLFGGELVR
jgi:hypothetical protein